MSIDWSNKNGFSYITGPRNQGGTNFCWGFAVTALVEAMVRIRHGAWCVRSEGDVFYGLRWFTFLGGNPKIASDFVFEHGIADLDCLPWFATECNFSHPESASADRNGRVVEIDKNIEEVAGLDAQKISLETHGPLIGTFDVLNDFGAFYYHGSGVYQPTQAALAAALAQPDQVGQHVILIVGFDDTQKCWIAKNWWGATPAHRNTLFRIAFGAAKIDSYAKFRLESVNPDPWTKRRHHSGGLFVSGNGPRHSNLEFVTDGGGVFRQYYRTLGQPWVKVGDFGADNVYSPGIRLVSNTAAIQTTYNRNLEVFGTCFPPAKEGPIQHWVYHQDLKQWVMADPLGFGPNDAVGAPTVIQSNRGEPGDFEMVVCTSGGSLAHWRRKNSRPWTSVLGSWTELSRFGSQLVNGPTMVQERAGSWPLGEQQAGNIHLICVTNKERLQYWFFDQNGQNWSMVQEFCGSVMGSPQMIEGMTSVSEWTTGPLELFVVVDNGVEHWRQPDAADPNTPWVRLSRFGGNLKDVLGVTQGHRGSIFPFDLICRTRQNDLEQWVLSGMTGKWSAYMASQLPV